MIIMSCAIGIPGESMEGFQLAHRVWKQNPGDGLLERGPPNGLADNAVYARRSLSSSIHEIAESGEQNHRHARCVLFDSRRQLVPDKPGHRTVRHNQVEASRAKAFEALEPVARGLHRMPS